MSDPTHPDLGALLGLIVHDLRNPGATIGANVAYVKEVVPAEAPDEDLPEALADVESALGDLMRGLEQVSWIGRWLAGQPAVHPGEADVAETLRGLKAPSPQMTLALQLPAEPLRARGGGTTVGRAVEILLSNSAQHARRGEVRVSARRESDAIVVEVQDGGAALSPDLYETAFTLAGQQVLKGRADGRYGRVAGLFGVKLLADAMGAKLEAGGEDGAAVFRLRLVPV